MAEQEERVSARGLACPQPVILVKRALENSSLALAVVDSDTAR